MPETKDCGEASPTIAWGGVRWWGVGECLCYRNRLGLPWQSYGLAGNPGVFNPEVVLTWYLVDGGWEMGDPQVESLSGLVERKI